MLEHIRTKLHMIRKSLFRETETRSRTTSAILHNALANVNAKNTDEKHWLASREGDAKFLNLAYDRIVSMTSIDDGTTVADYGCGTGVLAERIMKDFPHADVHGYDFSQAKIDQCRAHYPSHCDCFECRSIYDESAEHFDVILATEVLEHLERPAKAIKNLMRTLNPGGRLLLTVPDGRTDTFSGHIHFWSPESWKLLMSENVGDAYEVETGSLVNKNYALISSSSAPATK